VETKEILSLFTNMEAVIAIESGVTFFTNAVLKVLVSDGQIASMCCVTKTTDFFYTMTASPFVPTI
jgi:hypothetical protein